MSFKNSIRILCLLGLWLGVLYVYRSWLSTAFPLWLDAVLALGSCGCLLYSKRLREWLIQF